MENIGGVIWTLAVIGGPLLLAVAFVYGIARTRRRRRAGEAPTRDRNR